MFQYHHGIVPSIFNTFYKLNNQVHEHNTRQSKAIHNIVTSTTHGSKTLRKTSIKLYNHFRNIFDMGCHISTYKKHLKNYLIENNVHELDII